MTTPAQNQEWNIRSCGHVCAATGQPFADRQLIYSKVFVSPEGFQRADYSEAGWTDEARKDAVSHWKSVYRAPPLKPEDPLKKGTVETLLRQYMAREDFSKLDVVYILAVMLERKRILVEKDVQKRDDGGRLRIYEHKKTGEVFTIPDPELKLNELQSVQTEVNALLGIQPRKARGKAKSEPAAPAPESAAPAPTA